MKAVPPIQPPSVVAMALACCLLLLAQWGDARAGQKDLDGDTAATTPTGEVAPRGQRMARDIHYGEWRKVCFKTPGTNMICRTSISGTWDTGQQAIRADLIERGGADAARLQLFLPVGLYLPAGVKLSVDQGPTYHIPYVWCLTNVCIAADVADPRLIQSLETGQKLVLEVIDSNVLAVSTTLPVTRFAAAHDNPPAQVYEQDVDE
jgi:invasion protein IalB